MDGSRWSRKKAGAVLWTIALAALIIFLLSTNIALVDEDPQTPNFPSTGEVGPLSAEVINSAFKDSYQNDSRVISYIRKHYLIPPSPGGYHFDLYPKRAGGFPVSPYVAELLKHKKNGFYVEAGANDGEFLSNTLTLEMNYGWTGLLVEADPQPLPKLVARNRKAWVANVCLAVKPHPHTIEMVRKRDWSPISQVLKENTEGRGRIPGYRFTSQCFPLFSILTALNVTVVDYLGLDIEKVELDVLSTFPFNNGITIKVISAEVPTSDNYKKPDEVEVKPLVDLLHANGYKRMKFIHGDGYTHDLVFIHKDALA